MSPNTPDLGTLIARARHDRGLSMEGLAAATGVSKGLVWQWERGNKTPTAANLARVARALDVDFEDLFALAGYVTPDALPTLAPYLRTKYGLSDDAIAEAERLFADLRQQPGGADAERPD